MEPPAIERSARALPPEHWYRLDNIGQPNLTDTQKCVKEGLGITEKTYMNLSIFFAARLKSQGVLNDDFHKKEGRAPAKDLVEYVAIFYRQRQPYFNRIPEKWAEKALYSILMTGRESLKRREKIRENGASLQSPSVGPQMVRKSYAADIAGRRTQPSAEVLVRERAMKSPSDEESTSGDETSSEDGPSDDDETPSVNASVPVLCRSSHPAMAGVEPSGDDSDGSSSDDFSFGELVDNLSIRDKTPIVPMPHTGSFSKNNTLANSGSATSKRVSGNKNAMPAIKSRSRREREIFSFVGSDEEEAREGAEAELEDTILVRRSTSRSHAPSPSASVDVMFMNQRHRTVSYVPSRTGSETPDSVSISEDLDADVTTLFRPPLASQSPPGPPRRRNKVPRGVAIVPYIERVESDAGPSLGRLSLNGASDENDEDLEEAAVASEPRRKKKMKTKRSRSGVEDEPMAEVQALALKKGKAKASEKNDFADDPSLETSAFHEAADEESAESEADMDDREVTVPRALHRKKSKREKGAACEARSSASPLLHEHLHNDDGEVAGESSERKRRKKKERKKRADADDGLALEHLSLDEHVEEGDSEAAKKRRLAEKEPSKTNRQNADAELAAGDQSDEVPVVRNDDVLSGAESGASAASPQNPPTIMNGMFLAIIRHEDQKMFQTPFIDLVFPQFKHKPHLLIDHVYRKLVWLCFCQAGFDNAQHERQYYDVLRNEWVPFGLPEEHADDALEEALKQGVSEDGNGVIFRFVKKPPIPSMREKWVSSPIKYTRGGFTKKESSSASAAPSTARPASGSTKRQRDDKSSNTQSPQKRQRHPYAVKSPKRPVLSFPNSLAVRQDSKLSGGQHIAPGLLSFNSSQGSHRYFVDETSNAIGTDSSGKQYNAVSYPKSLQVPEFPTRSKAAAPPANLRPRGGHRQPVSSEERRLEDAEVLRNRQPPPKAHHSFAWDPIREVSMHRDHHTWTVGPSGLPPSSSSPSRQYTPRTFYGEENVLLNRVNGLGYQIRGHHIPRQE